MQQGDIEPYSLVLDSGSCVVLYIQYASPMIYPPQSVKRWWGARNSFGSVDRVGCPVVWSMVELCLTNGCKKYGPELYVQAEKSKLLPIHLSLL